MQTLLSVPIPCLPKPSFRFVFIREVWSEPFGTATRTTLSKEIFVHPIRPLEGGGYYVASSPLHENLPRTLLVSLVAIIA